MPLCLPRFKEMASKVFARRTFLWRNICGTVTATTFDLILRFYRLYLTLRYAVGAVYKPQDVSMMHGDQWYVFHHSAFRPSAFFCTIVTKLSTQPWAVPSVSPQCRSFKRDQTYHLLCMHPARSLVLELNLDLCFPLWYGSLVLDRVYGLALPFSPASHCCAFMLVIFALVFCSIRELFEWQSKEPIEQGFPLLY